MTSLKARYRRCISRKTRHPRIFNINTRNVRTIVPRISIPPYPGYIYPSYSGYLYHHTPGIPKFISYHIFAPHDPPRNINDPPRKKYSALRAPYLMPRIYISTRRLISFVLALVASYLRCSHPYTRNFTAFYSKHFRTPDIHTLVP